MKITKIRFENIHSLKGEHEIDFAGGILGEAGLFAITGPTGSGKSTLLDVITLAIYNRIARVDKAISNTVLEDDGGIMTRNMRTCYAEVEYRVNGKDYRSHWSIERNRNNNLNSRKQELVEIATGYIIESGTKTPEKNAEIIGLSYEQFVKAMVLSQGEFSKLLQAPRNERNKLLEDITGARSYREIGRAVFRRYSSIKDEVRLKEANLESIEIFTPEMIKEKEEELQKLKSSKPSIEKEFQLSSEKINIRKELVKKLEEEKSLIKNQEILKDHVDRFRENKAKLEKHEKLSKYIKDLQEYDSFIKEVEKSNQQLITLRKNKQTEESSQKSSLESASNLIQEELMVSNANERLETFRTKIVELQSKEKTKQSEAILFQNQIKGYGKNLGALGYQLHSREKPSEFKVELNNLESTIQETIQTSGLKNIAELSSKLESLRKSNEIALELLSKKQQILKLQNALISNKKDLELGEESISKDREAIQSLEKEILNLDKEIAEQIALVEHQRKHQSLEEHRKQLKPDEPCPLCGSLEHPFAFENPHFDVREELLRDNQKLLKTKSALIIGLQQKVKFQSDSNVRLTEEIKLQSSEFRQIENSLNLLAQQLSWNPTDGLEVLQTNRIKLNKNIELLEKSKLAFQAKLILEDIKKSLGQWEDALTDFQNLKNQRLKLYAGNNIDSEVGNLTTKLTQSVARISGFETQLLETTAQLKACETEKHKKKETLDFIVSNERLESIDQLRFHILDEETAGAFRRKDAQLKDGAARLSETEKTLKETLKELRLKDDAQVSLEDLTETFELAKIKWDELSINIGRITESLDKDAKTRERQENFLKQLNALKKDQTLWKTMNDLIGDANGNKFSNFVQDLTLEQLIGFANKRLMEFSDRYILDIPTAEEADKSDTLKIFDKYMGNARRSVRTLSGGETFLVSLAMAFALSDIASRNVKIESLFIDEGFGTLDPETLDQAITILEKMQNEGDKSVGVISHVGALKERITTQIKLEKGSLGYSTIAIIQ
ncbi:hypothetical protein EI546_06930 [Aequorivita sp. H23M31]|uniref:Rad50/SbcC-type AAA domain-containing protein n=1 Tax=Aequorivita ciconiae TaxID=2494375 RepID=A0A410G2L9_9FLAO|nr:AAA family ATPase [Aequorivita sp. H23M31]QAA81475.1 hypothetical protein EI546_06930 [Aequorivita sp. H23M31]